MTEGGFSILSWAAAAPGLAAPSSWLPWAESGAGIAPAAPFTVPKTLPLMTSRRLSPGARAGIECSIAAAGSTVPDFVVTASRDAELPRCEKILTGLADGDPESPTDFTMSVHNASSSRSAGKCREPQSRPAPGRSSPGGSRPPRLSPRERNPFSSPSLKTRDRLKPGRRFATICRPSHTLFPFFLRQAVRFLWVPSRRRSVLSEPSRPRFSSFGPI